MRLCLRRCRSGLLVAGPWVGVAWLAELLSTWMLSRIDGKR